LLLVAYIMSALMTDLEMYEEDNYDYSEERIRIYDVE
jgi:hypothetical protein